MNKIKITKEQNDALRNYKNNVDGTINRELTMFIANSRDWGAKLRPLRDFSPEQFALLLCGWYEVEEDFKVGDWVKHEACSNAERVVKVFKDGDIGTCYSCDKKHRFRKATADEIEAEQERRKWKAIGREVGEYKVGDIVTHKHARGFIEITRITYEDGLITAKAAINGIENRVNTVFLTLVTPVEHRFDKEEL